MHIRVIGVALLAAALSGCWVIDEIDQGKKKMELHSAKQPEPAEPEAQAAPGPSGPRMRAADYFASQKNARTLTPGQLPSDIVSCKLESGTQFMKQSECAARGGLPR